MSIRTYQPGDEETQAKIYNAAAQEFPQFKPASVMEVRRRTSAPDFDATTRFFAEEAGAPVGYCLFNPNGRISYPWSLPGHEHHAESLFEHTLSKMKSRGHSTVFSAYRADWPIACDFFPQHGFRQVREMVNFIIDLIDMPTPIAKPSSSVRKVERSDVPEIFQLAPEVFGVDSPSKLEKHVFENPYFEPDSLFVLQSPKDKKMVAVGALITDPSYANPKLVDSMMPCFRLGAFGTESRNVKRINGLFSFIARKDANVNAIGLDLLGQAAYRLRQNDEIESLAAQVASDASGLFGFYQRYFDRQGGFPVFEYDMA